MLLAGACQFFPSLHTCTLSQKRRKKKAKPNERKTKINGTLRTYMPENVGCRPSEYDRRICTPHACLLMCPRAHGGTSKTGAHYARARLSESTARTAFDLFCRAHISHTCIFSFFFSISLHFTNDFLIFSLSSCSKGLWSVRCVGDCNESDASLVEYWQYTLPHTLVIKTNKKSQQSNFVSQP